MKITGPLTAVAGVLLASVVCLQSAYLLGVSRQVRGECVRAELSGLSAALRWRLERDVWLRDHNTPAMERALQDLITAARSLEWAALYETGGRFLASAGRAGKLPPGDFRPKAPADGGGLPEIRPREDGSLLGLAPIRVAQRKLILAAGFPAERENSVFRSEPAVVWAFGGGLLASLLLVIRGLLETVRARRAGSRP